ncbi:hypothetical protein [Amycolatopsis sp. NPDC059021]|uniref:hypothetical protein n=1 Tax=Amycolatopsis sp. NPDC059021 TaxID=3346704 RepID=UPI00366BA252
MRNIKRAAAGMLVAGAAAAVLGVVGATSAQAATAIEYGAPAATAQSGGDVESIVAGAYKKLGKASVTPDASATEY